MIFVKKAVFIIVRLVMMLPAQRNGAPAHVINLIAVKAHSNSRTLAVMYFGFSIAHSALPVRQTGIQIPPDVVRAV